jgi:hypothetical protein
MLDLKSWMRITLTSYPLPLGEDDRQTAYSPNKKLFLMALSLGKMNISSLST